MTKPGSMAEEQPLSLLNEIIIRRNGASAVQL